MAPKKGGKKGGKKKKKEPEWGEIPRELFVNLEVRNSAWTWPEAPSHARGSRTVSSTINAT